MIKRRESDGYIYGRFSDMPWSDMQEACREGAERLRDFCATWEGVSEDFAKRYISRTYALPSNWGYIVTWAEAEGYVHTELVHLSDEEHTLLAGPK